MTSFEKKLSIHTKKVRLSAGERRLLRERLVSYMEYHPRTLGAPHTQAAPRRAWWRVQAASFSPQHLVAASFAFLLMVSVPIAAERAVPGDVLYPVKTRINESVRAQFADTPYEKIAFETELMERRIAEVRLLAREGKLTDKVEAQLAQTITRHADAAHEEIVALKSEDADEGAIAEITFSSALEVQSVVLAQQQAVGVSTATPSIVAVVAQAKERAEAARGTTTPSYERLSAQVERETTRAYELTASINGAATDEEQADIARRLSDIERAVREAHLLKADDEAAASEALVVALGLTQRLITFLTDIDVRQSVALNSLVPVVLTPEEERALLAAHLKELQAQFEAAEERAAAAAAAAASVSQEDAAAAAAGDEMHTEEGADIAALLEAARAALAADDFETARGALDAAEAALVARLPTASDEQPFVDESTAAPPSEVPQEPDEPAEETAEHHETTEAGERPVAAEGGEAPEEPQEPREVPEAEGEEATAS